MKLFIRLFNQFQKTYISPYRADILQERESIKNEITTMNINAPLPNTYNRFQISHQNFKRPQTIG